MRLSIIIVSFNTRALLDTCLESIVSQPLDKQTEIIVIDNASADDSYQLLTTKYTQVKVIRNQINHGFGTANNQGAKEAKGEWLLLLNSDTKLKPGTLDKINAFLKDADKNTVYGCQLRNKDNSIQPSAGYFPSLGRVFAQMLFLDDLPFIKKLIKPYQQSNGQFYVKEQEVDWVTGAFLLVDRTNFLQIGGFDESIFMYGEEIDLCRRLKDLGFKVKFSPFVSVYHFVGGSSGNGLLARVKGEFISLLKYFHRDNPKLYPLIKSIIFLGALLRVLLFGMISPHKSLVYRSVLRDIINTN